MKKLRQKPTRAQWIKMGVVTALYLAFLVWIKSWWGLLVVPFIYDAYITKRIPWTWWKEAESPVTRTVMSWVDAIVFALVAVYFVNMDFYAIAYGIGGQQYMQLHGGYPLLDSLTRQQQRDFFAELYAMGRQYIDRNPQVFGGVMSRPVDRRENYVKRCVGLPGQTLQIKDHVVYLDGKPNKEPDNVQYDYFVRLKQAIPDELVRELGISGEDLASLSETGTMPLTQYAYERLKACTDIVDSIAYDNVNSVPDGLYPLNAWTGWTRDNYGPIWIPAKGKSVKLTMDNIAVYERPIRVYEHNDLEVKDGKIFINGKEADSYTFKMDYYWMQGDNRHNSADSRYWGFVPEDHIVGKPILIWLSLDKDRGWFDGHVRWNRLFRLVDHIK